jgi:predicted RNase H-like HicB family nuclease
VYRQGLTLEEALAELKGPAETDERIALFVASLKSGTRGLVR